MKYNLPLPKTFAKPHTLQALFAHTISVSDALAKFLHCVRTACMLRTQRLGYSPKNTCHLSSSTAKQQSTHENNENAFKGLQGRQTSTCRTTHLHMHRFINV